MKLLIKHYGKIINGKKIYYNQPLYNQQLISLEGKEFVEVIEEKHRNPSPDQHKFYRGGILGTCIQTEFFSNFPTEDAIHENFFAPMFLSYTQQVITPKESKIITKVRSTADLSKKEYSEFIEKVIGWCIENDIQIGSPEDYHSRYYKTIIKK
jgi:hypothetical protein